MKSKVLIIISLIISSYGYAQKFDYAKLRNKPIKFIDNQLSLVNSQEPYNEIFPFGTAFTSHTSNLVKIKINDTPPIFHICNDSIQVDQANNKSEYLIYLNKKINLDSLFINAINGSTKYQTYVKFENYYNFIFNNRNFVVFRVSERRFFRNVLYYHLILLEIKNDKILTNFAFIDCPEETLNCFGDFNFDGNLDFIDWKKMSNQISLYSLRNSKFIKEKEFIIVKPSKNERIFQKKNDDLFNYSLVNVKKSKWFYKL